jgi:hypothetical protein
VEGDELQGVGSGEEIKVIGSLAEGGESEEGVGSWSWLVETIGEGKPDLPPSFQIFS